MRHLNLGRKLNRTSAHRKALFKNMFLSLMRHGRITTTDAKAKELRRFADRMVTLGKKGDLAAKRRAFSYIQSHQVVHRLFEEIAPRYKDRNGGYTRVVKFGYRRGDAAQLSIIEFTGVEEKAPGKKPKRRRREEDIQGAEGHGAHRHAARAARA
jgi:large subunit ribosomal protein L17